jgi:hypothetical protein
MTMNHDAKLESSEAVNALLVCVGTEELRRV